VIKPFFLWRDDWELDFDCLDKQHHQIVNAMNKLHKALVQGPDNPPSDKDTITRHLNTLSDLVRSHFKIEEYLMRLHEYPELLSHYREHRILLAELQVCIRDHQANRRRFNLDTLTALKHWQINHVISNDQQFADYLKSQSLTTLEKAFKDYTESES
jgi:hemerythrin